jgi:hypothetical protein
MLIRQWSWGCSQRQGNNAMTKKITLQTITVIICLLTLTGSLFGMNTPIAPSNYGRLLDYIQKEDLNDPLMVFGRVEQDFDRRLNHENIAYINANDQLLQQIQSHLTGDRLKWQLKTSFKQLWVVPEHRNEYAQLFEQYCRDAVDYLLARIKQPNPFSAIATLKGPLPEIQPSSDNRITAYLVHNIADEYTEEYLFFDETNDDTKIKIKLSNREFTGTIGSYTSKIKIGADNQFEFIHESFTLWQNSAQNPYNVLMVPIEETLHIILRSSTERAMHEELTLLKPEKLHEVNGVIDRWMAIEEAIVGGLVWNIMPGLLAHVTQGISDFPMDQTLAERHQHDQYRFLERGIDLVAQLGVDEAINLYQSSAVEFMSRLMENPANIESAQFAESPVYVN